ncbi:OsmC family protein [Fervidibacillus halotolerans]|uniref:OsmC family protein n=1 Tax=Fervidibacillus halotolerans TaxID=2980027 RepID=A0A9E8LZH9_9BACI|nr:OsmC family protein [Fervidibacillus halotolerans]WAA12439.1 OsmC family protein [Fervidibacillus halotolerans]
MEFHMKEVGFTTNLPYGELHIAGDEKHGFRPYQLLVSAIAVCSGGVLRKILEKKRIPIDDMKIKVEVERDEKKANRIEKIHLHYLIKGDQLDTKKIEKSIELVHQNCSMAQSVEGSIQIEETFELL